MSRQAGNPFLESNLSIGLLAKDTVFYGITAAASKISSLILIPILTRSLSVAEFGVIDTLFLMTNVALLLGNAGIDSALMYFYYDVPDADKSRLVAVGLWLRIGLGFVVMVIGIILSSPLTLFVFGTEAHTQWTTLSLLVVPLTLAVSYSLDLLRIEHERRWFLTVSLGRLLILVAGTWWIFSGAPDDPIESFLLFRVVSDGIAAGFLIFLVGRRHYIFSVSLKLVGKILRYGAPFLPATVMYWTVGFVDRWFLYRFGFGGEVGIYALSVKMGLILTLFVTAIQMAFNPFSMAVRAHEESAAFYSRSFALTIVCVLVLVLGLTANLQWLVTLAGGPGYEASVLPASILLVGNIFYVASVFFSTGSSVGKRTVYHIYSFGSALVIAVLLCAFLVPGFGVVGAAIAVGTANISFALVSLFLAQRAHPISYALARVSAGIALTVAVVVIFSTYNSAGNLVIIASKNLAGVLVAGIVAWIVLERPEWQRIFAKITSR